MKHITSRDNSSFKHLRALNDDARYRRESGSTVIDGDHLLSAAMDAGWHIKRLILRDDVVDARISRHLVERAQAASSPPEEFLVLAATLFKALSPVVSPSGILAEIVVPQASAQSAADVDVLAVAGVQDAGNLGTLLRTAVAAGVGEVWLDRQTANAWSPKALRAGMGAQFRLSIIESCDLAILLAHACRNIYVTHLGSRSQSLYAQTLTEPAVWVFGSEGQGVPEELLALATHQIRIPMPGKIESLNVAAAAAICLFEQVRQRQPV